MELAGLETEARAPESPEFSLEVGGLLSAQTSYCGFGGISLTGNSLFTLGGA